MQRLNFVIYTLGKISNATLKAILQVWIYKSLSTQWKYKVVSDRYGLLLFFFIWNPLVTFHLEVNFQGHTPLVIEILRKMLRNKW